jgi:tetratricopeptide (TPR) repeat protein
MGDRSVTRAHEAHGLVSRDPAQAVMVADEVLAAHDAGAEARCRARWARGLARRELHQLAEAEDDLRAAFAEAGQLQMPAVQARIGISLALVTFYRGSTAEAFELLDAVESLTDGSDRGHLELQRALLHHRLGDLELALIGNHRALQHLDARADDVAIVRVHLNLAVLHAQRSELDEAGAHGMLAIELADRLGQEHMAAMAEHNLGYAFARAGDLGAALEMIESADRRFSAISEPPEQRAVRSADRAEVLLKANLLREARDQADQALATLAAGANVTDLAETALLASRARLAAGDPDAAREAAQAAAAAFERQGRRSWLPLAEFVEVQADDADGEHAGLAERAERIARALAKARWTSEALSARVLAGRLYLARGDHDRARRVLAAASAARRVGPAGDRAAAYLASALLHEATGSVSAARRSVNEGLRTLFDNQAALGALELRAHAVAHGHELAEAGARLAVRDRRPRELLARIEAARGMIALLPRAHAPDDDVLAELLTDLRHVSEEIREAAGAGEARADLERRRVSLEESIRSHTRRFRADGEAEELGLGAAIGELGDRVLVEYGNLAGRLWAVTVIDGRAALHELGPVAALAADLDSVAFTLNRLNRASGSTAGKQSAMSTLRAAGEGLQRFLLPDRVRRSTRPIVIVPTGSLHGLAWRALPALAARDVSVSPSLLGWAMAHRRRQVVRPERTALVAGPTLPGAAAEIAALAALHPGATVLAGPAAIADGCIDAIERSTFAHVACHGAFRSDNPLFSTLTVADGELTLYDLERCRELPTTFVLSACSAAASLELRGGGLLGMSSALIAHGVSTVVAPLTPVDDELTVDVMLRFHRALAAGAAPTAALAASTLDSGDVDPVAAAFVALGA